MADPTNLSVLQINRTGSIISGVSDPGIIFSSIDDTNGNTFSNITNRTVVWIKNLDSSDSTTATFVTTYESSGLALEDLEVEVPALTDMIVGPFGNDFVTKETGKILVTWSGSGVADTKVCVLRV